MPLSKPEILGFYSGIAVRCWTPETLAQVQSIKDKSYLTREFVLKYKVGVSPSLERLYAEGLKAEDLRSVGLLADSWRGPYAFFRDRMIVPFFEGEQVVYLTSRRISDTGSDGTPLPKNLKAMSLPSPPNGVERPDGYGLNLLVNAELLLAAGLWLVECPMDAAYCDNIGQPAVGFIGGQLESRHGLIKRVRQLINSGVKAYVSLDGTPDVTEERRVLAAAAIHPNCLICQLPEGRDPDTLLPTEIQELKSKARRVVDVYAEALDRDLMDFAKGAKVWSHEYRDQILKQWRRQLSKNQSELRLLDRDMRAATGLGGDEYTEHVAKLEADGVKPLVDVPAPPRAPEQGHVDTNTDAEERTPDEVLFENPPEAVTVVPQEFDMDAGRPVVRNFNIVVENDDKGKPKNYKVIVLLQDIVRTLKLATGEWPRYALGLLFVHNTVDVGEPIRLLPDADSLFAYIHQQAVLRWDTGSDRYARGLITKREFYQALLSLVQRYDGLEVLPHEPPKPNYYYAFQFDPQYVPDGQYLRRLCEFFDNPETEEDGILIKAAILTPAWGAQGGKRPPIVFTAKDRGYGKGSVTEAISQVYGGYLDLAQTPNAEDRLITRLLSPEGLLKRVVRIDNVKGRYESSFLEAMITSPQISGHRLFKGEGARPNTLTFIMTGNALSLSRDLAERSVQIRLKEPAYNPTWAMRVEGFIAENRKRILADIVWTLRQPAKSCSVADRYSAWVDAVLAKCSGDSAQIVELLKERRNESDEDPTEAASLLQAIYCFTEIPNGPPATFITATQMNKIVNDVIGERRTAKATNALLRGHIQAGRLPGIQWKRTNKANGYDIMHPQPPAKE